MWYSPERQALGLLACLALALPATAQVGIGTTLPDPSAILHLESSTRGLLLPRVISPNADIPAPAAGLLVYNTTANELAYYNGTAWVSPGLPTLGPEFALTLVPGGQPTLGIAPAGVTSDRLAGDIELQKLGATTGGANPIAAQPGDVLRYNSVAGRWEPGAAPNSSQWTSVAAGIAYVGGTIGVNAAPAANARLFLTTDLSEGTNFGLVSNILASAGTEILHGIQASPALLPGFTGSSIAFATNGSSQAGADGSQTLYLARTTANGNGPVTGFQTSFDGTGTGSRTGANLVVNSSASSSRWGVRTDVTGPGTNYGIAVTVGGGANNYAATFAGGNVGIGTTTPAYPLDLTGTNAGFIALAARNTNAAPVDGTGAGLRSEAVGVTATVGAQRFAGEAVALMRTFTNHPLLFVVNGTERGRLDNNGLRVNGILQTVTDDEVAMRSANDPNLYLFFQAPGANSAARIGAYHGPGVGPLSLAISPVGGNTSVGPGAQPSSTLQVNGSFAVRPLVHAGGALTLSDEGFIVVQGNASFSLPDPSTCPGRVYRLVVTPNVSLGLSVSPSQQLILMGGGYTAVTVGNLLGPTAVTLVSDGGTRWFLF